MILSLTGCFSSRELDKLAIVMGIGIDKSGDKIKCCTQVIVPQNTGAGETGKTEEKPYTDFETEGKELSSCISAVSDITGKSVFMSHNLVVVFGEAAAEDGIYKYLDYLMRDNQLRPGVCLFVTDKNTGELLKADAPLFEIPSINLSEISTELSKNFAGQNITVLNFIDNIMSKQKGSIVPFVTLENGKIEVCGCAVFSGDRMVCKIDEKCVKGILWLLGDISGGNTALKINNDSLSFRIAKIKTDIAPQIAENGSIYFKADIKTDLYLLCDSANVIQTMGTDAVVERLNKSVKKEVLASLSKMKETGVDVYGFGDLIYRKDPAVWHVVESTWGERFKNINVEICADCNIIETGSIIGSVNNLEANME